MAKVSFNDQAEFIEELGKDKNLVDRGIIRVTICSVAGDMTDKVVKLESQVAKIETAPAKPQAPLQSHPQTVEMENKVKQLAEKVDKVEKTTFELVAKISEPKPQMKLGIQKVEVVQGNEESKDSLKCIV